MSHLYFIIFYQPLLNVLIFFYQTIAFGDLGLAIILLTLLVRLALYPLFQKSIYHQTITQRLQPELERIRERHQKDPQQQTKATMDLYRSHNLNPFSGFLFLIIQLPILIALYQIFSQPITTEALRGLYYFFTPPDTVTASFLGLIDLEKPSMVMAGLAALLQYLQMRAAVPNRGGQAPSRSEKLGRQMAFFGVGMTLVFLAYLPAAVGLYWVVTTAASIAQQTVVQRRLAYGKLGNIHSQHHKVNGLS